MMYGAFVVITQMQIPYTCEKEKVWTPKQVITNNYMRRTFKRYARIVDPDKITLNSVETFWFKDNSLDRAVRVRVCAKAFT